MLADMVEILSMGDPGGKGFGHHGRQIRGRLPAPSGVASDLPPQSMSVEVGGNATFQRASALLMKSVPEVGQRFDGFKDLP